VKPTRCRADSNEESAKESDTSSRGISPRGVTQPVVVVAPEIVIKNMKELELFINSSY
jgi:hypothetical protein